MKHCYCIIRLTTSSLNSVKLDVDDIVTNLKLHSSVCILYTRVKDSEDILFKETLLVFNRREVPVTVHDEDAPFPENCTNFLFVNTRNSICTTLSRPKPIHLTSYFTVIIFTSKASHFLKEIGNCSKLFDSANVSMVSTYSGKTFILSSPYFENRHFVNFSPGYKSCAAKDLQGQLVRVASFHHPPFTIIQNNTFSGLETNLWIAVASHLNLTWRLAKLEGTGQWGELLKNGSARGGITGALQDGAAEVSFSNTWHRRQYLNFADFGPINSQISLTFVVRRSRKHNNRWAQVYAELPWTLWGCIFVLWMVVAILYWWLNRLSTPPAAPSFVKSMLLMFGLLFNSSQVIKSSTVLLRCILISWMYFSFFINNSLVSQIMSLFIMPLNSPPVDTVQQMIKQNFHWVDRDYFTHRRVNKDFYFLLNNSWQNLLEKRYIHKTSKEVKQYLKDDLANLIGDDENLAFSAQVWGDSYVLLNIQGITEETDLSNFRVMRDSLRKFYTSFLFRKHFRLNELFSRTILTLQDHGLWTYYRKQFKLKISRNRLALLQDLKSSNSPASYNLSTIYPALVILSVHLVLYILVFCVELCCGKFDK